MYIWVHNSEEAAHNIFPPSTYYVREMNCSKSIIHQGDCKAQILWYVADKSVWCTLCATEMQRLTYRLKTSVNCCLANSSPFLPLPPPPPPSPCPPPFSSWSTKKWTSLVHYFVKKAKGGRSEEKIFCKWIQVILNLRKKKSSLPYPHPEILTVRNRQIYLII